MPVTIVDTTIVQDVGATFPVSVPAGAQAGDVLSLFVAATETINTPAGWTAASSMPSANGDGYDLLGKTFYRLWQTGDTSVTVSLGVSASYTAAMALVRGAETGHSSYLTRDATGSSGVTPAATSPGDDGVLDYRGGLLLTYIAAVPEAETAGVTLVESTTIYDDTESQASAADRRPALTIAWATEPFAETQPVPAFATSDAANANWVFVAMGFDVKFFSSADEGTEVTIATNGGTFTQTDLDLTTGETDYYGWHALWFIYIAGSDGTLAVDTTASGWDLWIDIWADDLPAYGVTAEANDIGSVSLAVGEGHRYWIGVSSYDGPATDLVDVSFTGPADGELGWPTEVTPDTDELELEWGYLRFDFDTPGAVVQSVLGAFTAAPPSQMIKRVSLTWPAPPADLDTGGIWTPTGSPTIQDWGTIAIVVDGVELTTFRGAPTVVNSWSNAEPFGDGAASFTVPAVLPIVDTPGEGDLSWCVAGSAVDIYRLHANGTTTTDLWNGEIVSWDWGHDANGWTVEIQCQGSMWASAGNQQHHAPMWRESTDRGTLIADVLNAVVSRRYASLKRVTTSIYSTKIGSWSQKAIEYVQELLSDMHTTAGRQWTVAARSGSPRYFDIKLKDTTTVTATYRAGQPGVHPRLTQDYTTCPNVIYGYGVAPDGGGWGHWHFPGAQKDDAPEYPFTNPANVISVGGLDTDAETDSGTGVTDWQDRMQELGYRSLDSDGVYSATDETYCRRVQRRYGILVDGIVGPQTWAATFGIGSGADLGDPIRLPLAAATETQKYLYYSDGSVKSANPDYDPGVLIVETDIPFGAQVEKDDAIDVAENILNRFPDPGWSGQLTCEADPQEGHRFSSALTAGGNISYKGWAGDDIVLHIAQSRVDPQSGTVTVDVDTRARDIMNLMQIRQRNRENPKPGLKRSRALAVRDAVVPFDSESRGGIIPKVAIYSGLWTVLKIPLAQAGKLSKVRFTSSGPAAKFSVALFGAKITAEELVAYVGNPLSSRGDGYGRFDANIDTLDEYWFIEAWGSDGQACGYYPGSEAESTTLTGRFMDTGSVEFEVEKPPWIYVALYSPSSTWISGRLYVAPVEN